VIDRDLPFHGRLIWVKGPPEMLTYREKPVRTIRTNIVLNKKPVYIVLSSIELQPEIRQSVGSAVIHDHVPNPTPTSGMARYPSDVARPIRTERLEHL
jgi:hypothetical protein